jgi:hypothetical protein
MNVGIGVYYHLNKAYISHQLCENRNNASMHCNGHCYLSKQLKKAEEKENKSTRTIKEKEELISNDVPNLNLHFLQGPNVSELRTSNSFIYSSDLNTPLLKPPIASVC